MAKQQIEVTRESDGRRRVNVSNKLANCRDSFVSRVFHVHRERRVTGLDSKLHQISQLADYSRPFVFPISAFGLKLREPVQLCLPVQQPLVKHPDNPHMEYSV